MKIKFTKCVLFFMLFSLIVGFLGSCTDYYMSADGGGGGGDNDPPPKVKGLDRDTTNLNP